MMLENRHNQFFEEFANAKNKIMYVCRNGFRQHSKIQGF